jgi:hypothetical protein
MNCCKCNFKSNNQLSLKKHMNDSHPEEQFNCDQCDFRATTQLQLNKHINLKHKLKGQNIEEVIQCNNCCEQFINTVALCKNNLVGKCSFTSEMCWWNHDNRQSDTNSSVDCFLFGAYFKSKFKMMIHRKRMHKSRVKQCNNFLANNCKFESKACWYMHEDENMETDEDPGKEEENEMK